jgi:hypothetical protein
MANLSKLDARIAVETKLQNVRNALAVLDKHTAQRAKIQQDIDKLNADEKALIASEDNHEERLQELLRLRAGRDLKTAAAATLDQRINDDGEAINRESTVVAQFLTAFHAAVLVNLQNVIQNTTEAFILKEDINHVMQLAMRHPSVKQIHHHHVPIFVKHWDTGYAEDIRSARTLDIIWSQLVEVADSIPGELEVSIPQPWLD